MDPITEGILQGRPYAGAGTNLERIGLQKVLKNIIEEGKYSVKFIIDYAVGLGYQKQMAVDVFRELTGLEPSLIVMNNEYLQNPAFVPGFTIAWGFSKNKTDEAYYVIPSVYGFGVMKKNEVDVPELVAEFATINEAVDELKTKVTKVFTADKIITEDLLKSEKIQLNSNSLHDIDNPYFSDPVRELKKRYRNKLINLTQLGDEIFKLSAAQEIDENEIKNLVEFKQKAEAEEKINQEEPELTQNREDNVDFLTEEARYLKGEEDPENMERAYQTLVDMGFEGNALLDYSKTFHKGLTTGFKDLVEFVAFNEGVAADALMSYYVEKETQKQEAEQEEERKKQLKELEELDKEFGFDHNASNRLEDLKKIIKNMKDEGKSRSFAINYLQGKVQPEQITEILNYAGYNKKDASLKRKASGAEDITLEDINEENEKTPLDEAEEKINNTDIQDLLKEESPQDYFEDEIKEDKIVKVSDKVKEIIETFVNKFEKFENYDIKLNSYKLKNIDSAQTTNDLKEDEELDGQAILQIIINISPVEDLTNIKKALAVFTINGNKVYWNGTVKAENNYFYAFAEEGFDALFKEMDAKEDIIEDII